MAIDPYSIFTQNGAPQFKRWDHWGHVTPNVEYSEGIRPTGEYMPAPYLPAVRFDQYFEEFKVVSDGKPVGFDSHGFLVPAGLQIEAANYKATFDATGQASADAAATIFYAAADVARGVKNAAGVAVTVGEPVVKSMFNIAGGAPLAYTTTISAAVGIADYDFWGHPGGDGVNPATFNKYNFNLQSRVGFLTDYVIQLPVVQDNATYNAAPFAGMAVVIAATPTLKPGMFLGYDANSNFVSYGYTYTALQSASVIGQVLEVRIDFPRDYLDEVRSRYTELGPLEAMPGTATGGLSHEMYYSGGYGMVTINLINR
jgi:hypothetical protein